MNEHRAAMSRTLAGFYRDLQIARGSSRANLLTAIHRIESVMSPSTLTKKQTKTFRADYVTASGPETLIVTVRHDDQCGNGHNTFSITGDLYATRGSSRDGTVKHADGRTLKWSAGGCLHDVIAKRLPELAPLLKWHGCSTDGPLHYIANTTYLAGDRDHWGLRKGEFKQLYDKANGLPKWKLRDVPRHADQIKSSDEKPLPVVLDWEPYGTVGEGKERELDAARRAAIWPDATDEELMADDLRDRLAARLPALLAEFRAAVESLGLTY
jgi:hypothetical protein